MTSEIDINEAESIRECANTPFENLIVLTLKEFGKTIKNLEERISFLENKFLLDK